MKTTLTDQNGSYGSPWKKVKVDNRLTKRSRIPTLTKKYSDLVKIKEAKKKDLVKLCFARISDPVEKRVPLYHMMYPEQDHPELTLCPK